MNSAIHCVKQIRNFFNPNELLQIITSNVYSILYYNSEIWNILSLHYEAKNKLLSISANALKICTPACHDRMSHMDLHNINKRATPAQMCIYKHATVLCKMIETRIPILDWTDLNFQQSFNGHDPNFNFFSTSTYRVGGNIICNRMSILNGKLQLASVEKALTPLKSCASRHYWRLMNDSNHVY